MKLAEKLYIGNNVYNIQTIHWSARSPFCTVETESSNGVEVVLSVPESVIMKKQMKATGYWNRTPVTVRNYW